MKEHKTIDMAAFDEIKKRWLADEADDVENAIYLLWDETDWMEDTAYLAATQYTAMQARIEKLAEYPERLQKAITELEALNPHTFMEGSRIDGKIQGVKLALGYFEEMTR